MPEKTKSTRTVVVVPPKDPPDGICRFCRKPTPGIEFCYGCKEYVCADCDAGGSIPWGGHDVEAHRVEADE